MPRPIGGSQPRDGRAVGDSFYLTSSGGLPDVLSQPCPVEDVFGGGGAGWAVLATPMGGRGGGAPVKTTTSGYEHHHQRL